MSAASSSRNRVSALVVAGAASLLFHNRFWASDEALWRRVAAVDPGNPAAFDWLGARALDEGKLDEAEALFHRSIAADPGSPLGYRNLALLLHGGRRQPGPALPLYERALAAFATRPEYAREATRCRLSYAACLAAVGRREEALAIFLEQAETPPYPPEAARNAAVLLRQAGREGEAREILARAAERRPDDLILRRMLQDLSAGSDPAEP